MSDYLLPLLAAAALAAVPLVLKLFRALASKADKAVQDALPGFLDSPGSDLVQLVADELEDAFRKLVEEAAARAQDGKLDQADLDALAALAKEETIGELKRQLAKLKK